MVSCLTNHVHITRLFQERSLYEFDCYCIIYECFYRYCDMHSWLLIGIILLSKENFPIILFFNSNKQKKGMGGWIRDVNMNFDNWYYNTTFLNTVPHTFLYRYKIGQKGMMILVKNFGKSFQQKYSFVLVMHLWFFSRKLSIKWDTCDVLLVCCNIVRWFKKLNITPFCDELFLAKYFLTIKFTIKSLVCRPNQKEWH